jgi:hypothetical protein
MLSRALAVCVLLLATTTECVAVSATNGATIASTIGTFPQLRSAIKAAAGKAVTLALSTPFDMMLYNRSTGRAVPISISAAQTHITIVGNGAVLIQGNDPFFTVGKDVTLVMSDLTLNSGNTDQNMGENNGGAINVGTGSTLTLTSCVFSQNFAVSTVAPVCL